VPWEPGRRDRALRAFRDRRVKVIPKSLSQSVMPLSGPDFSLGSLRALPSQTEVCATLSFIRIRRVHSVAPVSRARGNGGIMSVPGHHSGHTQANSETAPCRKHTSSAPDPDARVARIVPIVAHHK